MAEDNKIIAELIVTGVEKFKTDLASTSTATDELKKDVKDVGVEGSKSFDKLTDEVKKTGDEVEKTEKKTTSFKTQLKSMRQEIITLTIELNKMRDAGKQGTKEFNDLDSKIKSLTNDAGQLDDAISDVSGTIKNAGSDTRGLDRTLRVVQSVGAGFQLAQGATALFGSENKELANALIKLNGIMAVTNALQQIQDELLKEDSVLTGVASVAKRAYGSAVAFATGAMSVFRTVMISLGIGAFIAGVALLVANWDKLKVAIAGATSRLKELAVQREKDAERISERLKDLQLELKYKIAIGELTEKQALKLDLKGQEQAQKKTIENYKSQVRILNELKASVRPAILFDVNPGATPEEISAQEKKVKDAARAYQQYTIDISATKKELAEINKVQIDKPIKEATKSIKKLKDELPIKLTVEDSLDKFDEIFNKLITDTEAQLKSLFTAELLLGNNPQDNPQIRYLITQLDALKKELGNAKIQYDALLNPIDAKSVPVDITKTVNVLAGLSKISPQQKPLTFWERLFGTREQNQTEEQIQQERLKKAQYIVGQLNEIGNGIGDVASKAIAIRANNELSALEEKKKRGLISEKEYEKESAKIKNEAAAKQRKIDIAMALAKVPMVVLQALSSAPPPASFILAGISGALALAQVAILASTPLPKFKDGGLTNRIFKGSGPVVGPSHAQGGVNAELEGSEYVVKGDAVKKYGVKFFDEVNSLKFNPILSMPKQALTHHKKDTKIYEHMATIASYLKQGYKTTGKGNEILREIANKRIPNHNV